MKVNQNILTINKLTKYTIFILRTHLIYNISKSIGRGVKNRFFTGFFFVMNKDNTSA